MTEDNQKSTDCDGNGGNKPTSDHHELALAIKALDADYKAAQTERGEHDRKTLFWSRLTGIGVIAYTLLTVAIMGASIATAIISKRALLNGQRAFVHLDVIQHSIADNWVSETQPYPGGTFYSAPRNMGKMIHSKFALTNAGNTPTKALRILLHCELVAPQRADSLKDPFSLLAPSKTNVIQRSIGAHQTISISDKSCDFTNSDVLLNAQMRIVPVFFIGNVEYKDWVEPGTVHRTQFAHRLVVHEIGKMPGFDGMSVETEPVGAHNCTDDDCPND